MWNIEQYTALYVSLITSSQSKEKALMKDTNLSDLFEYIKAYYNCDFNEALKILESYYKENKAL